MLVFGEDIVTKVLAEGRSGVEAEANTPSPWVGAPKVGILVKDLIECSHNWRNETLVYPWHMLTAGHVICTDDEGGGNAVNDWAQMLRIVST